MSIGYIKSGEKNVMSLLPSSYPKLKADICPDVEQVGGTATKAYTIGSYFRGTDDYFYLVTAAIAQGATITLNTNCVRTDMSTEIKETKLTSISNANFTNLPTDGTADGLYYITDDVNMPLSASDIAVNPVGGGGAVTLSSFLGSTNISSIGDGTITGAIASENGTAISYNDFMQLSTEEQNTGTWYVYDMDPYTNAYNLMYKNNKTVGQGLDQLNTDKANDIITDTVTASEESVAANTAKIFQITCTKAGYTPLGVGCCTVTGTYNDEVNIYGFDFSGDKSKVNIRTRNMHNGANSVGAIAVILYKKN